jgi:hypothetical protein
MSTKSKALRLTQIETRRPGGGDAACVSLGGTNLYARDQKALLSALDQLQVAIEAVLSQNFCLIRQVLYRVVARELEQEIPERVFGAVLGRSLRLGTIRPFASLTVNNKILRTYMLASRLTELQSKLSAVTALLKSQTAVSTLAAQSICFPRREWATSYMAQQLMGHLALRGMAVYVDRDLLSWPKVVEDAIRRDR